MRTPRNRVIFDSAFTRHARRTSGPQKYAGWARLAVYYGTVVYVAK